MNNAPDTLNEGLSERNLLQEYAVEHGEPSACPRCEAAVMYGAEFPEWRSPLVWKGSFRETMEPTNWECWNCASDDPSTL